MLTKHKQCQKIKALWEVAVGYVATVVGQTFILLRAGRSVSQKAYFLASVTINSLIYASYLASANHDVANIVGAYFHCVAMGGIPSACLITGSSSPSSNLESTELLLMPHITNLSNRTQYSLMIYSKSIHSGLPWGVTILTRERIQFQRR